MMQIGHVRMIVRDGPMSVRVCMRAGNERLVMIVMRVGMAMQMVVFGVGMGMQMTMPSPLEKQDSHNHQQANHGFSQTHGSPSSGMENTAPANGAVAKYAASRAAPTDRRA